MKRTILALALGYVVFALITRAMEEAGAYSCACDSDCWCRKPGLSLFRWVFPRFHKDRALADWKSKQVEGLD